MSAAQKILASKLFACIVVDREKDCLFDLLAAPDAESALRIALRRKVNADVRDSARARNLQVFAAPVSDPAAHAALNAACEAHDTTLDALLADAVAYAVELERERISRRYRARAKTARKQRRATALTAVPSEPVVVVVEEPAVVAAPAEPAAKRGRLGWLAASTDEIKAAVRTAQAAPVKPVVKTETAEQAAYRAEREAVAAQVTRLDGATIFADIDIGVTRDDQHAINRAHKIVRTIRAAGIKLTRAAIRAEAAQYLVAAAPKPVLVIEDDEPVAAPAPAPAPAPVAAPAPVKAPAVKAAATAVKGKRKSPARRGRSGK